MAVAAASTTQSVTLGFSRATDVRGRRELSEDEEREVRELSRRDREVRAHEAAHKAAAGSAARGGPTFDTVRGPDGRQYAVGGEVQIDTAPVPGDPAATIAKLRQVERAARAPADPSPQDRRVAAEAAAGVREAQVALSRADDTERSAPGPRPDLRAGDPSAAAARERAAPGSRVDVFA